MSTTRRFCCDDLLKFNNINLDVLTETASLQYSSSTALCVRRLQQQQYRHSSLSYVSVSRQCKTRPLPRLPCCLLASASLYWPIIDLRNSGRIIALSHLLTTDPRQHNIVWFFMPHNTGILRDILLFGLSCVLREVMNYHCGGCFYFRPGPYYCMDCRTIPRSLASNVGRFRSG